ncbi:hypothetical protein FOA52_014026 [Chlamydomonas sp. UWO 241]|nr:hypothetical protein FOA52_014026 [Chlamydomonas sp. UWO 241]
MMKALVSSSARKLQEFPAVAIAGVRSFIAVPRPSCTDDVNPLKVKVGADIIRKALAYPIRLIASNAGVNGAVVMQKVLEKAKEIPNYGYNAADDTCGDLMEIGILDPTKASPIGGELSRVVRCTLENSVSVAKTFLLADVVVTEIPEKAGAAAGMAGGAYQYSM